MIYYFWDQIKYNVLHGTTDPNALKFLRKYCIAPDGHLSFFVFSLKHDGFMHYFFTFELLNICT